MYFGNFPEPPLFPVRYEIFNPFAGAIIYFRDAFVCLCVCEIYKLSTQTRIAKVFGKSFMESLALYGFSQSTVCGSLIVKAN